MKRAPGRNVNQTEEIFVGGGLENTAKTAGEAKGSELDPCVCVCVLASNDVSSRFCIAGRRRDRTTAEEPENTIRFNNTNRYDENLANQ